MSTFHRNEHGLMVRAGSYGRTSYEELADALGLKNDETLYAVRVENGTRISRPLTKGQKDVSHSPGTTFVAGPTITKAAFFRSPFRRDTPATPSEADAAPKRRIVSRPLPPALRREVEEMHAGGFGSVPEPEMTPWGWGIKMKGLILAGGIRTDAMILLPESYPAASPIGFYLRKGANTGSLDRRHLFDRGYHGALDLSAFGWQWFCGVPDHWIPGRHTLLSYVSCVFAMFTNENLKG